MRIGIDVGGTTVKIGIIDDKKIIDSFVVETKKETLFVDVCEAVKEYLADKSYQIEFIGFGLPGHVVNGFIYNLPNVGIRNVDLKKIVKKHFPGVCMQTTNDANAAALGEAIADTNMPKSSYMITLGTGVGGGYVYDYKVVDGYHSSCGEVGHMYVDYIHNYECSCGLKGCLETVASATGIVRLAKEYFNSYVTSLDINNLSAKSIFDAAKNNDPLGLFVFDKVCSYLGRGLATIAACTDVEVFYIGGGVSACGEILIEGITKYYKEYAHYAMKSTRITLAKLGNSAGMLGAAYLK